jgi:RNA polymerase sigma factor (sigma-70 family)
MAQPIQNRALAEECLPDGALLDRFIHEHDSEAFETLLTRHAPKVLRICRRNLQPQDAEDACQATFLVLVNHAAEIRQTANVSGWLCAVARRVSIKARIRADRRQSRESAMDVQAIATGDQPDEAELCASLRAEVNRLPEKYRRAIELCYWEGLSTEKAAEQLECPTGTLKWRLSRARELLRSRLGRAGLAALFLFTGRAPAAQASLDLSQGISPEPDGLDTSSGDHVLSLRGDFVDDTLALATFIRDSSFHSPLRHACLPITRGRTRWGLAMIPIIAILALILGSLTIISPFRPASANSRTAVTATVPARSCH